MIITLQQIKWTISLRVAVNLSTYRRCLGAVSSDLGRLFRTLSCLAPVSPKGTEHGPTTSQQLNLFSSLEWSNLELERYSYALIGQSKFNLNMLTLLSFVLSFISGSTSETGVSVFPWNRTRSEKANASDTDHRERGL